MRAAMEIELNGLPHLVKDRQNVHELVDELNLAQQALAVAVNREIVPRSLWLQRVLQPHDRVDLVRPIGGG
jgi:sulfur carrier protein